LPCRWPPQHSEDQTPKGNCWSQMTSLLKLV